MAYSLWGVQQVSGVNEKVGGSCFDPKSRAILQLVNVDPSKNIKL